MRTGEKRPKSVTDEKKKKFSEKKEKSLSIVDKLLLSQHV